MTARYAIREALIVVSALVVGPGAGIATDAMTYRSVYPLFQSSTVPDALSALDTINAPMHIIIFYLTVRLARWIRDLSPAEGDDVVSFDAYGMVSILCWCGIIWNVFELPWRVLWG